MCSYDYPLVSDIGVVVAAVWSAVDWSAIWTYSYCIGTVAADTGACGTVFAYS